MKLLISAEQRNTQGAGVSAPTKPQGLDMKRLPGELAQKTGTEMFMTQPILINEAIRALTMMGGKGAYKAGNLLKSPGLMDVSQHLYSKAAEPNPYMSERKEKNLSGGLASAAGQVTGEIMDTAMWAANPFGKIIPGAQNLPKALKYPINALTKYAAPGALAGAESYASEGFKSGQEVTPGGLASSAKSGAIISTGFGVGGDILRTAYGAIGKRKMGFPGPIKKGLEKDLSKLGEDIEDILNTQPGETIDTRDIINKLENMKADEALKKIPGLEKKLDSVIDRLYKNKEMGVTLFTPKEAQRLKQGFWQEIYGEAGKELQKRGGGASVKHLSQVAGGDLSGKITSDLQSRGVGNAKSLWKEYGDVANMAQQMSNPTAGAMRAGILSGLAGGAFNIAGVPQVGVPIQLVGTGGAMPYTKYMARQGVGRAGDLSKLLSILGPYYQGRSGGNY